MSNDISKEPIIRNYKDIKPEKLEWLWPNKIPLGKLSLLVGHPGVGKSFLSLYMAAQVSSGNPWIDTFGSQQAGSVLILSLEDDPGDTISVRLIAAGANTEKIFEIQGIKGENGIQGLYNLTRDMDMLIKTVMQIKDIRLIIIDPISAYMEGKNENKNAEVREFLNPLIEIAKVGKLAIVGISHLNKNQDMTPGQRILGSTGFLAATRAAWLVQIDKNDSDRRLFVPLKGNLSAKPTGLAYRLMSQSVQTEKGLTPSAYCAFEPDPIYITAEELLDVDVKSKGRPRKQESAEDWLWGYLANGMKPAESIRKDGEQAGYSWSILKRVKQKDGIQAIRMSDSFGGAGSWGWTLPPD